MGMKARELVPGARTARWLIAMLLWGAAAPSVVAADDEPGGQRTKAEIEPADRHNLIDYRGIKIERGIEVTQNETNHIERAFRNTFESNWKTASLSYALRLNTHQVKKVVCPHEPLGAKLKNCIPGRPGLEVKLAVEVRVYDVRPAGATSNRIDGIVSLTYRRPVVGTGFEREAETAERFEEDTGILKSPARYLSYRIACRKAAAELARHLRGDLDDLPAFDLSAPVAASTADGVEFMLGDGDGVSLDDTFAVMTSHSASGFTVGFVKVRSVGSVEATGGPRPSRAQVVSRDREPVQSDVLVEYDMMGLSLGARAVTEILMQGVPFDDDGTVLVGVGVDLDFNLAPWVGLSEFYISFAFDALFGGEVKDIGFSLIHLMLGLKKKWYLGSWILMAGARGGYAHFKFDVPTDQLHMAPCAEGVLGLEYTFRPEVSLYLDIAGRYSDSPFGVMDATTPNDEWGVVVSLGARLGL